MPHPVLRRAAFLGGKAARASVGSGYTYRKSALVLTLYDKGVVRQIDGGLGRNSIGVSLHYQCVIARHRVVRGDVY
jgi:hypothetical protein